MADRTIPEDDQPVSAVPQPGNGPGFSRQRKKVQDQYRRQAMLSRIKSKAGGNKTAHQLHVLHQQHQENVKNNPAKYNIYLQT